MIPNRIGSEYLHRLQAVYKQIGNRGIRVHTGRLSEARQYVNNEIINQVDIIKQSWGCHVYLGAANDDGSANSVNLNASSGTRTPLLKLKSLGYKIPTIAKRNEDTGDYESKESLAELALQRIFSANQFSIAGGDPVIKALLRVRELSTLKTRYINARLYAKEGYSYYLSTYKVCGTVTGRRSSTKHAFNFGNNAQNFPSHGSEAPIFKRCLVPRRDRIFLFVDQIQAEEWPVSALANNINALKDLANGVDRHRKLASAVFNVPLDQVTDEQRYLGKKIRHARNYGMKGQMMSDSLAKEGYFMPTSTCQFLLDLVGKIDPNVSEVFHKYVEQELYDKRILRNPLGRECIFFGLRAGDGSGNSKIFREAYSWIPQSTVGDNTGFAVYELGRDDVYSDSYSTNRGYIVQEGHDSIVKEVHDHVPTIWDNVGGMLRAFDRELEFHNGICLKIPIEGKIGYDFNTTVTLKSTSTGSKRLQDVTYDDLKEAYGRLQAIREKESGEEIMSEMNYEPTDDTTEEAISELDN